MDDNDTQSEQSRLGIGTIDDWVNNVSPGDTILFPFVSKMKQTIGDIREQFPKIEFSVCTPRDLRSMVDDKDSILYQGNVLATCEQGVWRSMILRNAMFEHGIKDYNVVNPKKMPDQGISIKNLAAVIGKYESNVDQFISGAGDSLGTIVICTNEVRMPLTLESLRSGLSLGMSGTDQSQMPINVILVLGSEAKFNIPFAEYI